MTSITPSAQYRLNVRVEIDDSPGLLGAVTSAIGQAGGVVGAVDPVEIESGHSLRDIVVDTAGPEHWETIVAAIDALEGAHVIDRIDRTFQLHIGGKIEQHNKHPLKTRDDLSMAYTPGVARVCMAIHHDFEQAWDYTIKANSLMVVSDGSDVLGLGDIGAEASLPACEAKSLFLRNLAGIDAFPLPVDARDPAAIVDAVALCSSVFAGDRKSTRLNSSHMVQSRMPSSA